MRRERLAEAFTKIVAEVIEVEKMKLNWFWGIMIGKGIRNA
jgi:hypothetical protein